MKRFTCNLAFLATVLPIAAMAAPVPPYGYATAQQALSAGAQSTQLNLPQWLQGKWQVSHSTTGQLDVSAHGLMFTPPQDGETVSEGPLDFHAGAMWMTQLGLNILSPQSSANSYQLFVGVNESDSGKNLLKITKTGDKQIHFSYRPAQGEGIFDMEFDLIKVASSH